MIEKIIGILNEICGADEGEILPETELFDEGVLDSFGLVQLIVELENLGKSLDIASVQREDISTPAKLAAMME